MTDSRFKQTLQCLDDFGISRARRRTLECSSSLFFSVRLVFSPSFVSCYIFFCAECFVCLCRIVASANFRDATIFVILGGVLHAAASPMKFTCVQHGYDTASLEDGSEAYDEDVGYSGSRLEETFSDTSRWHRVSRRMNRHSTLYRLLRLFGALSDTGGGAADAEHPRTEEAVDDRGGQHVSLPEMSLRRRHRRRVHRCQAEARLLRVFAGFSL